jgi:four helix bundle protein
MFLQLSHNKMDVYQASRKMVLACYKLSNALPDEERFGLVQQIRRASTSVSLNISEGSSRKSDAERKRYYEISRGSVVEIDSIMDLCSDLHYCTKNEMQETGDLVVRCFQMLSAML